MHRPMRFAQIEVSLRIYRRVRACRTAIFAVGNLGKQGITMLIRKFHLALALSVAPLPAAAQNVDAPPGYAQLAGLPVPVVEGDIADRPYRVVGHVIAGVRKATIFSKSASQEKVYRELWERGRKLGADAVIKARYGEAHITALSWGSREAHGEAIKFLTDAEIAALPQAPATPPASDGPTSTRPN